ncbi:D-TA family PLP-dependent enzyme [Mucilaginibacter agri]|uniref:D-TA family PLP-dependent enzyme n=1 Tax=Mucilaginibacter agri TaxID=2695265 RepID=A0A966DU94_9SPHI|nr:D-TA family PLP-dependent enzyme [Mucilaginibacter agri]NCD70196.1 D-TA family PLP-dependent enzyme [Mucilaginibacter agri]
MNWYEVKDVDQLDSPALVVYPDRVRHNIALAINMAGDVSRLRPHIKTHKNKHAALLQIEAGISKFKCATIAEAEILGMCKAPDVLLAYQPVGPKLKRFISIIEKYPDTQYACLVDNLAEAEAISVEALVHDIQIPVYVDLNVGMNRTGIAPGEKAQNLYLTANTLKGVKPVGLHAYDGHIHEADLDMRNMKSEVIIAAVRKLQADIVNAGADKPVVIAGGSPTFPFYAAQPDVECSPGTFVYWDAGYQEAFAEQQFLPAALVVTRVVSLPDETKVCLDLGHKSVASESPLDKRVRFLNAAGLAPVSQSEEHLVMEAGAGHHYKPGDVLYGVPYHICPTVAVYERAITIENNQITGEWLNEARDRKITV